MKKIACVGDNCIDYYDATGEAFPGGNPVNVAVYIRRMGGVSSYTGAVGNDRFGTVLLDALREKGVDVSHVKVIPGTTALTHVTMENGDRVLGDYDEGVMADYRPDVTDVDFLCTHDLVVTGLWGHAEGILGKVRKRGVPVAFDGAERPFDPAGQIALPHTDIAFFSDDTLEDEALREKILRVAAMGPKLVVATRGSRGSLAWDGVQFYTGGIVSCPVVDTMGAGDSFIAGFLMAWLEGKPVPSCMQRGAEQAAFTIGYAGGW